LVQIFLMQLSHGLSSRDRAGPIGVKQQKSLFDGRIVQVTRRDHG